MFTSPLADIAEAWVVKANTVPATARDVMIDFIVLSFLHCLLERSSLFHLILQPPNRRQGLEQLR